MAMLGVALCFLIVHAVTNSVTVPNFLMLCCDLFVSCLSLQYAEVPDQPDPPTNDTTNARSVLISWMDPLANNAPILRYEVNVYARPFGIVVNRTIVTNISTELLINELLPFVMYEIRVRAVNIVGRGELSDPLIITTDEDGKQRVKNEWSSMNLNLMFFLVL